MILRCSRSKKNQKRVEARVAEGKCLGVKDDGTDCDAKPVKLGLCQHCHTRFYNVLCKKSKDDQQVFRQKLIQAGRLLQDREVLQLKRTSFWKRMA